MHLVVYLISELKTWITFLIAFIVLNFEKEIYIIPQIQVLLRSYILGWKQSSNTALYIIVNKSYVGTLIPTQ